MKVLAGFLRSFFSLLRDNARSVLSVISSAGRFVVSRLLHVCGSAGDGLINTFQQTNSTMTHLLATQVLYAVIHNNNNDHFSLQNTEKIGLQLTLQDLPKC